MKRIYKKVKKAFSAILLCSPLVIIQTAYQTAEGQTSTLEYQLWHDLNTPLSGPIGNKFGWTQINTPGSGNFGSFLSWGSREDKYGAQIFINYDAPEFWYRQINNGTTNGWKKLVNSDSPTFTGNVGIGTTTPSSMLDVNGEIRGTKLHVFNNVMDAVALVIQGATISNDNRFHYVALSFDGDYGNATGNYSQIRSYSNLYSMWGSSLSFHTTAENSPNTLVERMRILYNGNVGIGTTAPNTKLDVNGTIRANEVIVNTPGADFVFEPDYNLTELSDIEKYIKKNKHLPNIKPASEMQKDGMNVSEMQTKLLQKIEELTLYVIELKKEMTELKKKQNE